jgi:NADH dehydrogenase
LHLYELPGNRIRVVADWLLDAMLARPGVRLGLLAAGAVPLDSATPELPDLDSAAAADTAADPAAAR